MAPPSDWRERLTTIVATMREISAQRDPEAMVEAYGRRMKNFIERDRMVTLSRRGHTFPEVRITRDTEWAQTVNPWKQRDQLPVIRGGLLADLIYGDQPRVIDDLDIAADDPGAEYVRGQRSVMAIPLFDEGVALNMVLFMRRTPQAFKRETLPEQVWVGNLFGRATHNLVLSDQLSRALNTVDLELKAVADMQRALLPAELPKIATFDLAAYYETSRRAGGDYYDLFPLTDGRWGILIADVSGHGTPAAVMMAITHALAHTYPEPPCAPGVLLTRLNRQLAEIYTRGNGTFITAFYGIYDPHERVLIYANAGHNPPRLKRCADGSLVLLDGVAGMPLGIEQGETYSETTQRLQIGDQIVFYTDGIVEAFNPPGQMFGTQRLDDVLANCALTAHGLLDAVVAAVGEFTAGRPADDDRTVLIGKVT